MSVRPRLALSAVTFALVVASLPGCSLELSGRSSEGGEPSRATAAVTGSFAPRSRTLPPPATSHCSPAPQLHATALCVCHDLELAGELVTRSRDGHAADVGVEGAVGLASGSSIDGSLRTTGDVASSGELSVAGHLWSKTGVSASGELLVSGDLATGGDLDGAGTLGVGGALRVAGRESFAGDVSRGDVGAYAAPTTTPCGCAPEDLYDVGAAVAAARTANDNAAIGLDAEGLVRTGDHVVELPSGRYYLGHLAAAGDVVVRARGAVQLYVEGDVDLVGTSHFRIDPGASIDLFVAGSVASAGSVELGDPSRADAFRLYVGGKDARVDLAGEHVIRGLVYAPTAEVSVSGDTRIEGALFAGSLAHAGSLDVTYAPVTVQGDRCEHPEATPLLAQPDVVPLRRAMLRSACSAGSSSASAPGSRSSSTYRSSSSW